MKKYFFLFLNCILIIGCRSQILCTQYFSTMSAEEIESIAEDTLTFRTSYLDHMFKSHGMILEPNMSFGIKYDTLSRYRVILGGKVFFSIEQEGHSADLKSDKIELSYVIVKKEGEKAKRYSCNYRKSDFNRPLKDCPIPSSIMKEIRKDFFIRMKYQRYRDIYSDSLKGLTVMHEYLLF